MNYPKIGDWKPTVDTYHTHSNDLKRQQQPVAKKTTPLMRKPSVDRKPFSPVTICQFQGCKKRRQAGPLKMCIAHGGGVFCKEPKCKKRVTYRSEYCVKHDTSTQCEVPGCTHRKAYKGNTTLCVTHGGGIRCYLLGCDRHAPSGDICEMHKRENSLVSSPQHLYNSSVL